MKTCEEMPLLLHELVIGSTNPVASVQSKYPTSNIAIATISHPPTEIHNASLQQNRIVAIANNQRLSIENGSRLAEALAGNSPYVYSAGSSHNSSCIPVTYATAVPTTTVALKSSGMHTQAKYKGNAKPYHLPIVLQDHNYGAPPPQTPPQSPPSIPHVTVSSIPCNYKSQYTNSASNKKLIAHHPKEVNHSNVHKNSCVQDLLKPGKKPNYNVNAIYHSVHGNVNSVTSVNAPSNYVTSSAIPRSQFMPQPKSLIFSPNNATSPTKVDQHNLSVAGMDTDEESRLSDKGSSGTSGEETETAPEGDGEEMLQPDDSITRCICDLTHDDGYMIQCDRCFVWQHVDCMQIDRNNIPDEYLCEACNPRKIDKAKAKSLQVKRMQEIRAHLARLSSSDSEENSPVTNKNRSNNTKVQDRKVLKKKKTKPVRDTTKSTKKQVNQRKKVENCSASPKVVPPPPQTQTNNSSATQLKTIVTADSSKSCLNEVEIPINSQHVKGMNNAINSRFNNEPKIQIKSSEESLASNNESKEIKPAKTPRRRQSSTTVSHDSSEESGITIEQLCVWAQNFEVAVTNHYSPELRAKIQSVKVNGVCEQLLESANGASMGHRWKFGPKPEDGKKYDYKTLLAAGNIKKSTAIIEYQGKYMLFSQWTSPPLIAELPYLPYVVQYNMVKEGVVLCIDSRTYGNVARFARKAPEHNAELRHIIKRGSIHVYIVAVTDIDEGYEIILSSESAVCLNDALKAQNPSIKCSINVQEEELLESVESESSTSSEEESSSPSPPPRNGSFASKRILKKSVSVTPQPFTRTTRRTMSSSDTMEELQFLSPTKQRRSSGPKSPAKSPTKSPPKAKVNQEDKQPLSPPCDKSNCEPKLSREERKLAAVMKMFEKLERQEKINQRRRETGRRRSNPDKSDFVVSPDIEKLDSSPEGIKKRKQTISPKKLSMSCEFSPDHNDNTPNTAPPGGSFRFPKKTLMNEWLNETVNSPVLPKTIPTVISGVPSCYMRSPSTPTRRFSGSNYSVPVHDEMAGRAAKKRWLRQAIIDESEPTGCSTSPNSRPDSPNSDYIAPLKKRRLARESMSSDHSNTPPSTPHHFTEDGKTIQLGNGALKTEYCADVKKEKDEIDSKYSDRLSINVSDVKNVKQEVKEEKKPLKVRKRNCKENGTAVKSSLKLRSNNNKTNKCKKKAKIKKPIKRKIVPKKHAKVSELLRNKKVRDMAEAAVVNKMETEEETKTKSEEILKEDVNNTEDSIPVNPSPMKRKLSISEYRKRKNLTVEKKSSISNGNEKKSNISNGNGCIDKVDILPLNDKLKSAILSLQDECTSPDDSGDTYRSCSSPYRDHSSKESDVSLGEEGSKWDDAPTLLEQRGENLSARLRKFGLSVSQEKKEDSFSHCEDVLSINTDMKKYLAFRDRDDNNIDKLLQSKDEEKICDKL